MQVSTSFESVAVALASAVVGKEKAAVFAKYLVFVLGGAVGLAINLGATYIFHSVLGMWQMLAYAIGLSLNILFNFIYHRWITFNVKTHTERRLAMFTAVTLAVVAANWLLVYLFAEVMGYNIYVTSVVVVVALSVINFIVNRIVVFK